MVYRLSVHGHRHGNVQALEIIVHRVCHIAKVPILMEHHGFAQKLLGLYFKGLHREAQGIGHGYSSSNIMSFLFYQSV